MMPWFGAHLRTGRQPPAVPDPKPTAPSPGASPILAHAGLYTAALCLLWLLPGLLGRSPWKPDEPETLGIAYQILLSGDWVVPAIAGEPWLYKPPLMGLTAAAFARVFEALLPVHEAARLASLLYAAVCFGLVGLAARELLGPQRGWLAVLALLGCLGLAVPAHLLVSDMAQFAGFALALYGLALALRRPVWGGVALGTGAGIGFLSNGLFAPACLALAAVMLPVVAPAWRTRRYAVCVGAALLAALPWLAIWPLALYRRSPELFDTWLALARNRFAGGPGPAEPLRPGYFAMALAWFAFPALPLAAWGIWVERLRLRQAPQFSLPLVLCTAILLALAFVRGPRELFALPLLAPLAVLAVPGVLSLRRGAAHAFWWFSILFGSVMVLMGWFEWCALELGFPGQRHRHWLRQAPAYVHGFDWRIFLAAAALTAFWVWVLLRLRRTPERPLVAWASCVTVVWALALTLFTGYLDVSRGYRSVLAQIERALPERYNCVSRLNLADAQRALLHVFAGIVTRANGRRDCELLLVQGPRTAMPKPGPGWQLIWEGARSGDNKERFRLYRRS
jgi:4-amino-4-deoxy-L-arabinose transferase-like glycosyltransferase